MLQQFRRSWRRRMKQELFHRDLKPANIFIVQRRVLRGKSVSILVLQSWRRESLDITMTPDIFNASGRNDWHAALHVSRTM